MALNACSPKINFGSFVQNAELILTEGSYQLISNGNEETAPFRYSTMGIYLVIEANNGLILMWDRKTSLFLKLSPNYKVTLQYVNEGLGFTVTAVDSLKNKRQVLFFVFKLKNMI